MNRYVVAVVLFLGALLLWWPASPVVQLIAENREVLLGRYSRGHFSALFVLTLLLWSAAGVVAFSGWQRVREVFFSLLMIWLSTGLSIFVLVIASGSFHRGARYVEQTVQAVDADTGIALAGIVRHRPPGEHYDFIQKDEPEQARSYPHAPSGYPPIHVLLTSDGNGFRNREVRDHYDMVVVGDSFAVGSQVSDEQAWPELLRQRLQVSLYNLGVSGTAPNVYLNNFVTLGRKFAPKTVLVMIYEGNDFHDVEALPVAQAGKPADVSRKQAAHSLTLSERAKASPVTLGLKRFSAEVLEKIARDSEVPDYDAQIGWMPLALKTPTGTQYYTFPPKRLAYLDNDPAAFAQSSDWRNVRDALQKFVELSQRDHFRLVFLYAPSAPHVLMPLAREQIPAVQLQHFLAFHAERYRKPDAEQLKRQLFARLDTQENTWMNWCREQQLECVSLTQPLRAATAAGRQTYLTYDQHWTPEGNAVAAEVLAQYLGCQP